MTTIRVLDPGADFDAVLDLFERAADHVELESGLPPGPETAHEFFAAAPPGARAEGGAKLGLFEAGRLAAISDMGFGYPEAADAYIGLLIVDAARRGAGLGRTLLARNIAEARARGAQRLLIAVLEENPRGRAFWEREGFADELRAPPAVIGQKTHVRIRMARPI